MEINFVTITKDYKEGDIDLNWGANGVGIGHLSFEKQEDGSITCNNEYMSREFVKEVLNKLVDNSIFLQEDK